MIVLPLFDLEQAFGEQKPQEWKPPTFKDCAALEIVETFFNCNEHACKKIVDGKEATVIFEEDTLKPHNAHWEAGAKQNFDTGLYLSYSILYISVADYGPRPKMDKLIVLKEPEGKGQRTYKIKSCETEDGIYRMTLERVRQ